MKARKTRKHDKRIKWTWLVRARRKRMSLCNGADVLVEVLKNTCENSEPQRSLFRYWCNWTWCTLERPPRRKGVWWFFKTRRNKKIILISLHKRRSTRDLSRLQHVPLQVRGEPDLNLKLVYRHRISSLTESFDQSDVAHLNRPVFYKYTLLTWFYVEHSFLANADSPCPGESSHRILYHFAFYCS